MTSILKMKPILGVVLKKRRKTKRQLESNQDKTMEFQHRKDKENRMRQMDMFKYIQKNKQNKEIE